MYGRTSDRSVALEKVRGTGSGSSERRWRGGGSLFSRREGRKAAVERGMVVLATAAPSRRCSTSGPAESPPGGESAPLLPPPLQPLSLSLPLPPSLINSLAHFRLAIAALFVYPLRRIAPSRSGSASPLPLAHPLSVSSLPPPLAATLSHPVAPTLLQSHSLAARELCKNKHTAIPSSTPVHRPDRSVTSGGPACLGVTWTSRLSRLAVAATSYASVARHVLPARDTRQVATCNPRRRPLRPSRVSVKDHCPVR